MTSTSTCCLAGPAPTVDAGTPLRAWRVRALVPSKSVATQHRSKGHHRADADGSHETVHTTTMISGRRVHRCVRCEAMARSGVGVVKHQRAPEMKRWSQEPTPKRRALNTVTRGESASFEAFVHVSKCEIQSSKTWTQLSASAKLAFNRMLQFAMLCRFLRVREAALLLVDVGTADWNVSKAPQSGST